VTLTIPGYEGFELIVKANSVTFPDGSHTGPIVVSPVHNDRLPMVPPGGAATFGTLGWTIQPTGTRFDPPAQVKIPNPGHMTAGQTAQIVQWDHDLATFIPMGRGTVSEDASQIITDFGSGITKAGWGGCTGPACPPDPGFPQCAIRGNCSDCGKVLPAPSGACPICEKDPLKEGRKCENDPCKICSSGECVPKFKSANIQSMTRFDFVDPKIIPTEEIPQFGLFVSVPEYATDEEAPSYADWNVDLQARCENGGWTFKVKKAVISTKIFLNSSIMNILTVGGIAAANCPGTDVLEYGVRKGAGQGVRNINNIYECYEAAFAARGNFTVGRTYIQKNMVEGHELVHFDRFKSDINAEVKEFVSTIEGIEILVLENENPNDAVARFLSGDFYKQKIRDFAETVRERRGDSHKNPVDFYKAMMCSDAGKIYLTKLDDRRRNIQSCLVDPPNCPASACPIP
jgi:hypothetical protein